jgi:hypothetical protein
LGKLNIALIAVLYIMNIYYSVTLLLNRILRYKRPLEDLGQGYLYLRQINVHILYHLGIYLNGASLLYLYIRITK